jgi:protein involved in polysaccharide export with SLBB domain
MNSFVKNTRLYLCLAILLSATAVLSGCSAPDYAFADPPPGTAQSGAPVSIPPTVLSNALNNAGANTNAEQTPGPDWLYPGVRITITFSGVPPPSDKHEERIREDGYINPPFLGRAIKAADRTVGQLQEELQKLYVPDYFRTATITVRREETFYFVGGEVKAPGRQVYLSEMTVLKAIQTAGDFTDFAKRSKVQIIRANGKVETVNCDKARRNPKLDKRVFPNDTIHVPRRIL